MTIIRYAIDSQGAVHDIKSEKEISSLISTKQRINIMWQIASKLIDSFNDIGVEISKEKQSEAFDYMFQPYGFIEYILLYTKTPLSSTSNEVKLAYLMKTNPEKAKMFRSSASNALKSSYTDDMLKSIFKDSKKDNLWYIVNTVIIKLERNKFDGKIINITLEQSIPYHRFVHSMENQMLKIENGNVVKDKEQKTKYFIFSPSKRVYTNERVITDTAITTKKYMTLHDELNEKVKKLFMSYYEKYDSYSNIRASYINYIVCNPMTSIFPVYNELKIYLKSHFDSIKTIQYKGNRITFYLNPYGKQTIYACRYKINEDSDEPYHSLYILNGHNYNNIQELQYALLNYEKSKCFIPLPSFYKNNMDIINYYFTERKD